MADIANHLTDKIKKKIIADRAEGLSYRALARKYNTSATTIKRVVTGDPDTARLVAQKKEENTEDILAHMDEKRDKVILIMDCYLDALLDKERIEKANLTQLTTALGTLIDKWAPRGKEAIQQTQSDDPITVAIKEEVARGILS